MGSCDNILGIKAKVFSHFSPGSFNSSNTIRKSAVLYDRKISKVKNVESKEKDNELTMSNKTASA